MFWIAGASRLGANFGNFHQRLQRLQEATGRDERPGLSDTQIRKGDAEPLNLSGFELDLFSLPLHVDFCIKDETLARLTNRLPQHGGLPKGMWPRRSAKHSGQRQPFVHRRVKWPNRTFHRTLTAGAC